MRFQPRSEKEIAELNLLPKGTYDCEVFEAEEKVSRNNNDMIVLKLFVYDDRGNRRIVTDWLLESVPHKLRHAAKVFGLIEDYEAGTLQADAFVGKPGRVKLGIRKDKNEQYPDQNNVVDYVGPDDDAATHEAARSQHTGDDGPRHSRGIAPPIVDDEIPWSR